jgi:DNA replication protein DnaC
LEEEEPLPWTGGLLFGPTGVGKTYRAIRELLMALRAGRSVVFVSLPRYIVEMREVATAPDHRLPLLRSIAEVEYAVLDDLGGEKTTEYAAETLYLLVDGRLSKGLRTLVTSNLNPDEIARVHGDRIISRIQGFGPTRRLDGQDRRLLRTG